MSFRRLVRLKGSVVDRIGIVLMSAIARLRLRARGCRVGPGLRVRGYLDLYVHEDARFEIGGHCRINSGFRGNAVGGFRRVGLWVGKGGHLRIGDRVGMSGCTIVCTEGITIESDVMIGGDTQIYDTDFHPTNAHARLARHPARSARIILRRGCFIGGHSIILKGVEVGERAVVGAGSVVTRSVPSDEVWAGNPAKCIRRGALPPSARNETE